MPQIRRRCRLSRRQSKDRSEVSSKQLDLPYLDPLSEDQAMKFRSAIESAISLQWTGKNSSQRTSLKDVNTGVPLFDLGLRCPPLRTGIPVGLMALDSPLACMHVEFAVSAHYRCADD